MIKAIESKCISFLWSGKVEGSKGAKVSWATVYLPRKEGGLGLMNISSWNKTCVARLIWLIFSGMRPMDCLGTQILTWK